MLELNFNSFSLKLQQSQLSQANHLFASYFPSRQKSKALILSFFDRCHYSAGYKFLSLTYKAIARACSLSIRTIERQIPELISEGWVIASISRNGFINRYKLNIDKIQNTIGQLAKEQGVSHPPTVVGNPRQLTGDLNNPSERNINKKQKEKVFENNFAFNKRKIPKPILKNKKQKQQKDILVGQQKPNLNNGQNIEIGNKAKYSAPQKIENQKSYDHIQLDDEGWCIDDSTENFENFNKFSKVCTEAHIESNLTLLENERQEYLDRAENVGVQLDAWLKNYCLSISLKRLDDAINCLEQQIANKRQAKAKAKERGETNFENNPRYQVGNPTNFLIQALNNQWKPNTKSECYSSNGSWREPSQQELRSRMTPADIKSKYKPDKWREAAEHFGYSYDEIANAVVKQSEGKKSLLQKLKDLSQKLQI